MIVFLYRVKVEELTAQSVSLLKTDLDHQEQSLRSHCPIREMSVVADDGTATGELDIYFALDDFIDSIQLTRLFGELRAMIAMDLYAAKAPEPRISTELIHI
jgi:hypothetical protein